jgi:hypothetical protein
LKSDDASAAEPAQPRKRILRAVDLAQRIKFIDRELHPMTAVAQAHRLESGYAQPSRDQDHQDGNMTGLIWQKGEMPRQYRQ